MHVRIEVRGLQSHRDGTVDLCAELDLDFFGLGVRNDSRRIRVEVPVRGNEAGDKVAGSYWAPAIGIPLRSHGKMQAQIGLWVSLGKRGDLGKPRGTAPSLSLR